MDVRSITYVFRQKALRSWRDREPSPTYGCLLAILVKAGWKDAKDVLVSLCQMTGIDTLL